MAATAAVAVAGSAAVAAATQGGVRELVVLGGCSAQVAGRPHCGRKCALQLGRLSSVRQQLLSPLRSAKSKSRRSMTERLAIQASQAQVTYDFPSAPILLPEGPWTKSAGMYGGLRAKGQKPDLALVVADKDAVVAGVFTKNLVAAAPVVYCREVLAKTMTARACLINAGQANAATGEQGRRDSEASAERVAEVLGVSKDAVLLQSTGVIGQRIKIDKLLEAVPALVRHLSTSAEAAEMAATAITTTDLVNKSVAVQTEIDGTTVRIGGMTKGSGMIHPNMATMLGVLTCDAAVKPEVWRLLVQRAVQSSFNQITVDGDTSTNDTVIAFASGQSGVKTIDDASSPAGCQLEDAITAVCQGLAKSIAWDGEGATVLVEVEVRGAADKPAANQIAKSVVASSLVKSAIYGRDPNWGRIAAAAGYAGVDFDTDKLKITLGPHLLMEKGQPLQFDRDAASKYMKDLGDEHGTVEIQLSVGDGPGVGTAWGCDLTYDYVKINAEYTT
eukprot:jgi/Chlat1/2877/Chrsp195S03014